MFDSRKRPKGLEVPSCEECNAGTRISELFAAVLGRIYPDASSVDAHQELQKLMMAINNNVPGVLEEMEVRKAKAKFSAAKYDLQQGGFLQLGGPIATAHLDAFAAKLGFAFHFLATNKPVPISGGVVASIKSNLDAIDGKIPDELFQFLGPAKTLIQGKFNTADQFLYSVRPTDDGGMSMAFASFRRSFSVITFAADTFET